MKKLMVLLIIAGLVPVACAELMPDGGFEGTGVWSGYGGYFSDTAGNWQWAVIDTTADAHTGSKALVMTAPGSAETWAYTYYYAVVSDGPYDFGADGWAAQWQAGIAAAEGDVLQATAWVKEANGNADTGVALLKVELKNDTDDTLHTFPVYADVTADWTQILLPPFIVPGASQGQTVDSLSVVVGIEAPDGVYHSVVFDDVSLTVPPGKALIPGPAVGATDVPVSTVLTWITGDPNTTDDKVFFGTTGTSPLPEEAYLAAGTETWDPPGDLEYGTEYSWRVDEWYDVGGTQNDYVNVGDLWFFTTITKAPLITSEPNAVFATPNGSTTVGATDYLGGTANLTYQWYNSSGALSDVGAISGSTTATLTFTAPDDSYADSYYCIVSDTVEALDTTSDSVSMDIPRLVAHYPFEGDFSDVVGGYDGLFRVDGGTVGDPTFAAGQVGSSAIVLECLDRSEGEPQDDDWINIPSGAFVPVSANDNKEISIALWAYLAPETPNFPRQTLFSGQSGNRLAAFYPGVSGTGEIVFENVTSSSTESVSVITDANDLLEQWSHLVFTKNANSGEMKIYMDGVEASVTSGNTLDFAESFDNGAWWGANQTWGESFTGRIDDARLYNYALSDAQVAQLYACSSLAYDLDFSCNVDLTDFSKLAEQWDGGAGGGYDINDLVGLCSEWLDDNTL